MVVTVLLIDASAKTVSGVTGWGLSRLVTPSPRSRRLAVLDDAEGDAGHTVLGHLALDERDQRVELRIRGHGSRCLRDKNVGRREQGGNEHGSQAHGPGLSH